MSATPGAAGPNTKLLIGAGVGCGCLSLIIGAVVIFMVIGAIGRSPGPTPQPVSQPQPLPQPAPQPPGPQPQPPGPQPQPQPPQPGNVAGPPDFQVRLATVKVQGEGQNMQSGAPSDVFSQGERVGAFGQFVTISGTLDVVFIWAKVEGENAKPVTEPKKAQLTQAEQGKRFLFTLSGAPPGEYAFGILRNNGGNLELIAVSRFRVQ